MKKFVFLFLLLFTLTTLSGCKSGDTVRFESDDEQATESSEVSDEVSEDNETTEGEDIKLAIISFIGNTLNTDLNRNIIEGITSTKTRTITVNEYVLQRYIPGTKNWSYIASTALGTMQEGENEYVVKTFDANGEELESLKFTIDYRTPAPVETVEPEELPSVGANLWITLIFSFVLSGIYGVFRKLKWL